MRLSGMNKIAKVLSATALLGVTAGAAPSDAATPAPAATKSPAYALYGTQWVVDTLYTGQSAAPSPTDAEAHLTFDARGRVSGSGGCNALGGQVKVTARTMAFSEVFRTLMACLPNSRNDLENAVLDVLNDQHPVAYSISGKYLTLRTPEHGLRLHATTA